MAINFVSDLPVHLVIERSGPASEDAGPDALASHAVRQLRSRADQPRLLNTLAGDAIIHDRQEKTARLSLQIK